MISIILAIIVIILINVGLYFAIGSHSEPKKAIAKINGEVDGVVYFEEKWEGSWIPRFVGTRVYGKVTSLKPGLHGFHIHQTGNLNGGCDTLGDHYNPTSMAHGPRVTNGHEAKDRHYGDLGNIDANESGMALIDFVDKYVHLRGPYSVIGRGIVVHEKPDDLGMGGTDESVLTGSAGKRIGCGVIGLQ